MLDRTPATWRVMWMVPVVVAGIVVAEGCAYSDAARRRTMLEEIGRLESERPGNAGGEVALGDPMDRAQLVHAVLARNPNVDAALHARPLYTEEDAELLTVLSEKCCMAIEATRLREQSDATFFQALQAHEKKGNVGKKLDELQAMIGSADAAALIDALKAELG